MPLIRSVSKLCKAYTRRHLTRLAALDYEGIYRKSGGSGQSKTITQLFERGDYASFDLRDNDRFNDICSVTSVLKTYFRSLPDPLLTFNLHEKFIYAASVKDPATKGTMFTEAVSELPKEHYHTTRALMLHLHRCVFFSIMVNNRSHSIPLLVSASGVTQT